MGHLFLGDGLVLGSQHGSLGAWHQASTRGQGKVPSWGGSSALDPAPGRELMGWGVGESFEGAEKSH